MSKESFEHLMFDSFTSCVQGLAKIIDQHIYWQTNVRLVRSVSLNSRTYFLGTNVALNHISPEPRHFNSNKLVKKDAWCPGNITINDTNLKMYIWDKKDQGNKKQSFILEGWPPDRSRDPRNYINLENFTVLDIDGCEKGIFCNILLQIIGILNQDVLS